MAQVVQELAIIAAASRPDHGAEAMLDAILKLAGINRRALLHLVRILTRRRVLNNPLSDAMLLAFHEVSAIRRTVGPHVLALSMEKSVYKVPHVLVAVGILFTAMTVAQRVSPLSLVHVQMSEINFFIQQLGAVSALLRSFKIVFARDLVQQAKLFARQSFMWINDATNAALNILIEINLSVFGFFL